MCVRRVGIVLTLVVSVLQFGCSMPQLPYFDAPPEPWRASEEQACLSSGRIYQRPWLVSRGALGGARACGAIKPFVMAAAAGGTVALDPPATLRCNMIPAVERFVQNVVEPAARRHYGRSIMQIKVAASYSCRPMNNVRGAPLSEHGHANAIDISGFRLSDGRLVTVKHGWWGNRRDRSFLRAVHAGGCNIFTTALGPAYDANHHNHFHFDLRRRRGKGVCT